MFYFVMPCAVGHILSIEPNSDFSSFFTISMKLRIINANKMQTMRKLGDVKSYQSDLYSLRNGISKMQYNVLLCCVVVTITMQLEKLLVPVTFCQVRTAVVYSFICSFVRYALQCSALHALLWYSVLNAMWCIVSVNGLCEFVR
jgi:uncharacterized membrane protein (DUF106 family)